MTCRTAINHTGPTRRRGLLRLLSGGSTETEPGYVPVGGNPMEPIAIRAAKLVGADSILPDISLLERHIDG